jgi:uncharacterized protein YjbI with pentapeptide repeats
MLFFDVSDRIADCIMKFICSCWCLLKTCWGKFEELLSKKAIILILASFAFGFYIFPNSNDNKDTWKHHIFEIIGVIAIPLALMHERNEMHQQLKILEKQEILNSWMIINTRTPGSGGKKDALEFLAKKGENLQGIDLSSETHGGSVLLQGLDLSEENIGHKVNLSGAKFNGAILYDVKFDGANLNHTIFNNATLDGATFKNATLNGMKFNFTEQKKIQSLHFNSIVSCDMEFNNVYLRHFKFNGTPENPTRLSGKFINTEIHDSYIPLGKPIQYIAFIQAEFINAKLSNIYFDCIKFNSELPIHTHTANFINSALYDVTFNNLKGNIKCINNEENEYAPKQDVPWKCVTFDNCTLCDDSVFKNIRLDENLNHAVIFKNSSLRKLKIESDEKLLSRVFSFNNCDLTYARFNCKDKYQGYHGFDFKNNYITHFYNRWHETMPLVVNDNNPNNIGWQFRFVMKDGTYQRNPKNIDDIKQEKGSSDKEITKYFIHPVKSDTPDPSQEKPIS